ncbi:MAG: Hsp20/alpha crystallin family protein [Luteolibacter sp.]|uniref:Hsp20/alpha crystallin family protein n=1 Tax=Luteolibacter sp. TaxID=1962973 RepID=UPI003265E4BD
MNTCDCPTEATPAKELDEIVTRPRFNTTEDENGVTLHIALPAVSKEDLKLTLHESGLRIEARRADAIPETWKTHRDNGVARRYGLELRLTRRFDGTKATATLDSGVLTLRVPVREEAKPRQIEVN